MDRKSPPGLIDNGAVPKGCLHRDQVKAIAAGRCTEPELAVVRGHLADCSRCRAAIAARAGGVRGPGHTVLLERVKAPLPTALKVGAVAMSLLAAVTAWRYAAAPQLTSRAPATIIVATARNEPLVRRPSQSEAVPLPAVSRASVPDAGVGSCDAGVAPAAGLHTDQTPARRRPSLKPVESVPSATSLSRTPSKDELDFGIDEPAPEPSTRPTIGGRVIRTTLD